jgi:D-glycero-alpha-D-manno-heptose-7-phosphate kinase
MLWMTRTPLRVSLFGGGTDYPEYFHRQPGAVVGFAINKYIHIACLRFHALQEYNYRVAYSRLELSQQVEAIEHPVVREVVKFLKIPDRLDISVMSDLPATGSGLGSSSSFTVGFIKLMTQLIGRSLTKIDLAKLAIKIERDVLVENVGVQDQLHAAFGGVNRFDFDGPRIRITPLQLSGELTQQLGTHMVLVHTGIMRRATAAVEAQVHATKSKQIDKGLSSLYALVEDCVNLLERPAADVLPDLGRMLVEGWHIKRQFSKQVSNDTIDDLFGAIMKSGAYGAKLCGAGGGGFFLAIVPPERQHALIKAIHPLAVIPVDFDVDGSTLVYPALAPGMEQRYATPKAEAAPILT